MLDHSLIKTALIVFLALFFFANGINHFLNPHVLHEYMEYREFNRPKLLVFLSGLLLIICGPLLLISNYSLQVYAAYTLGLFVLVAAFLVHSFWKETDKHKKMLEIQNFIKNFVIFFEMIYLAGTF